MTSDATEKSIAHLLEKNAKEIGDKTAIHFDHENLTFTYSQLNERVDQFANTLFNEGVKKRDHVAVMLPRRP